MSTKIYCAYRFPLSMAPEAIDFFHKQLLKGAVVKYDETLEALTPRLLNWGFEKSDKPQLKIDEEKELTINEKMLRFNDLMYVAHPEVKRLLNWIDCGFNAWIHTDSYMYVAIHALFNHNLERKRKFPVGVEEFGYWDNTDPPTWANSEEGYEKWEARGKKWEEVGPGGDDPGFYKTRLYHEVVETSHMNGMMELQEVYCKKKKIKPYWQW